IGSYVGGDITAGIIASNMHTAETKQVLVDLGTNGELSLGDKHGIIACATAAGPVFEGANIHFGMPALPGAISSAWSEDGHLGYETIGDIAPKGVCGTGLVDIAAYMYTAGIFDATGRLVDADECPEQADWLGKENGMNVFYLTEDKSLYITQRDIRNIQLGKSAVFSGIMVLLFEAGLGLDDVSSLDIAGGFGKYINLESAATLGVIPGAWLDRAHAIGNSSVEGASAALLSSQARADMMRLLDTTEYIELSLSSKFNEYFVENMMFPEL
ncbi:MAG: ASKHA domain-containing protein, partial [Coriobacteriales bacterium]|nr:ASKHA domain-containing protein [Coriobacteriales bacterium]